MEGAVRMLREGRSAPDAYAPVLVVTDDLHTLGAQRVLLKVWGTRQ